MPSMGLGKEGKEVVGFPDVKTQVTKEGLGFFEGYDRIKKSLGTLNRKLREGRGKLPLLWLP